MNVTSVSAPCFPQAQPIAHTHHLRATATSPCFSDEPGSQNGSLINTAITGNRLVERDGVVEHVPKQPFEVIGEMFLKPIVDQVRQWYRYFSGCSEQNPDIGARGDELEESVSRQLSSSTLLTDNVCFGAERDTYGVFSYDGPTLTEVIGFKLAHNNGLVTCNYRTPSRYSFWGCDPNHQYLRVMLTRNSPDTLPDILVPTEDDPSVDIPAEGHYTMEGFNTSSPSLLFQLGSSLIINPGDIFRLYYTEDYYDNTAWDNDGVSCAAVLALDFFDDDGYGGDDGGSAGGGSGSMLLIALPVITVGMCFLCMLYCRYLQPKARRRVAEQAGSSGLGEPPMRPMSPAPMDRFRNIPSQGLQHGPYSAEIVQLQGGHPQPSAPPPPGGHQMGTLLGGHQEEPAVEGSVQGASSQVAQPSLKTGVSSASQRKVKEAPELASSASASAVSAPAPRPVAEAPSESLEVASLDNRESSSHLTIPDQFVDGVSFEIMTNPYTVGPSGYSYDLATLNSLRPCLDPSTRQPITSEVLNRALKSSIEKWIKALTEDQYRQNPDVHRDVGTWIQQYGKSKLMSDPELKSIVRVWDEAAKPKAEEKGGSDEGSEDEDLYASKLN